MDVIMKIQGIRPLNPMGLENRPDTARQGSSGKARQDRGNASFDEYLEARLREGASSSSLQGQGQDGGDVLKRPSDKAMPCLSLSLNDIIPELHFPFQACSAD